MKARTLEDLTAILDQELAWRRKELSYLRSLASKKDLSSDSAASLVRSCVALLYAHWEGFIKAAASAYVDYVDFKRLNYDELIPNFVALGARRLLGRAQQSSRPSVHNEVAAFFLGGLGQKCNLPRDSAVDTKSNLSSDVFREILAMLGLDYSHYATKAKLIDETLLRNRNTIAHGKYLLMNFDRYLELQAEIMALIDLFKTQIENAAATSAYLRKLPT